MILRRNRLLGTSTLLCSLFCGSLADSYTTSAAAASSTPTFYTVAVGSNGFRYNPNTTFAQPGDTVVFQFFPTNHSVIRAEYTDSTSCPPGGCNPCVPYELSNPGQAGFSSGNFLTQDDDPNTVKTWNLTINDTQPIFFYCDAIDSCHPNGMVGVINPNSSVSLENQYQAAIAAPYQLAPGQSFPAEGGGPTTNTSTSAQSSTAASSNGSPSNSHLSGGAIAGIAVGAIAVLLLAAALFYFVGRSKTYHDLLGHKASSTQEGQCSQTSDMGPWSPAGPMSPASPNARFSAVTAYSHLQAPPPGRFIGYNRRTGAPEFATEVPESPPPNIDLLGGFNPQLRVSGVVPTEQVSVELPGDAPAVAEKGPTEK